MDIKVDARVVELLCSRLCHDLISPVSAINNGFELITEFGDEMRGEAMSLMGDSAREASRRLQFFRIAFGGAGTPSGDAVGLGEARVRALELLADGKIALDWPEGAAPADVRIPREGIKLLLNMLLVAIESLAGAGSVSVRLSAAADGLDATVTAASDKAGLGDELKAALAGAEPFENLTPVTAQAYYTSVLAAGLGSTVAAAERTGQVELVCRIPTAG